MVSIAAGKKQGKRYQLKMQWQLIQTLRQRYDMVLNLADQWPSAVISKLTGAATRIGFDFPKRRHPVWRYCHTALASTQQHNQLHTVQQNLYSLCSARSPVERCAGADGLQRSRLGRQPRPAARGVPGKLHHPADIALVL